MITVLLLFKFEQKLRGRPFGVRSLKANDDGVLKSTEGCANKCFDVTCCVEGSS